MGRQVNFYMLPADLAKFEHILRARGDTFFVAGCLPSPEVAIHNTLRTDWLRTYLIRGSDSAQATTIAVPAQGYWHVDALRSPVVEFDRCYYDGTVIGRGRLYFQPGFYADEQWVDKTSEFIRWADSLIRWVRRHYRRDPQTGYYVGPHAWEWVTQQGGTLRTL